MDDKDRNPTAPPSKVIHFNKEPSKHNLRIPFLTDDSRIGLGDVISKVTYAVGIGPCPGCRQRAARLNRWISFRR